MSDSNNAEPINIKPTAKMKQSNGVDESIASPIQFNNTYNKLPNNFHSKQLPTPVDRPQLIITNSELAQQLNIDADWLNSDAALNVFAGNAVAPGSEPIATAYAGHQFGHWNPKMGDGRAILLGEVVDVDGLAFDIQLKGAGPTPYSRGGDGRSQIGPVVREYLVSEAMHTLGVPTSRALAAVTTGEAVVRRGMTEGAILTRVARSHIRIGTFEFFAAQNDFTAVKALADYVLERHYPQVRTEAKPYVALLQEVVKHIANLVAQWMSLGFIHGVMNTDNMLVSGQTIDYGPCAFMDYFNPSKVYSSIDRHGRYAFDQQPAIAQWNLLCLAQALLPLLDDSETEAMAAAQQAVNQFTSLFETHYYALMNKKLGLTGEPLKHKVLVQQLLTLMAQTEMDYTLTLRYLTDKSRGVETLDYQQYITFPDGFETWLAQWQAAYKNIDSDMMAQHNPIYMPRNHLVEEVIQKMSKDKDIESFNDLLQLITNPYQLQADSLHYQIPPTPIQVVEKTFCGT